MGGRKRKLGGKMNNKYSMGLLMIMGTLLLIGIVSLFAGFIIGIIPIFLGVAMLLKGFRELSAANPREAGLITFFGNRMDDTKVKGLIFIMDWLPFDIVGVTVFNMQKVDKEFPVVSIRCCDGIRMNGSTFMSASPDENHLGKYDDAQRMDGIHAQFQDMHVTWLQEIAIQPGHDYKWMETHPNEIAIELRKKLDAQSPLGNIENLGFKINKLQVRLKPINTEVIKADESQTFEMLDRLGQVKDTKTINNQTEARYQMYLKEWEKDGSPAGKKPQRQACRKEIFDERLAKAGKYEKMVNEGGVNVIDKKGVA
jgi:hypothetical protein